MEKEPSRVKAALFGPTKTGKSTYKATLLGRSLKTIETPTNEVKVIEKNRKFKKMVHGELRPLEEYKLVLVDLPGREKFENARLKAISSGVIGCALFYDASDPTSAKKLIEMTDKELVRTEYLKRLLGITIIGNKEKNNVSSKAVRAIEKLRTQLNSSIEPVWGYEVPHLIVSAKKRRDVLLSFFILETILSSKQVPEKPLQKYSASNYLKKAEEIEGKPKKRQPSAPQPAPEPESKAPQPAPEPESKAPQPAPEPESKAPQPHQRSAMTPEKKRKKASKPKRERLEPEIRVLGHPVYLFPSDSQAWQIPERLIQGFNKVTDSVVCRFDGKEIYIGYYPKSEEVENIPREYIKLLKFFHDMVEETGEFKRLVLKGEPGWFVLFNRKGSMVLMKTEGKPSEKIKKLF